MKFDKNWLNKRWGNFTVAACSAVVLYLVLSNLHVIGHGIGWIVRVILPVIIGLILAYILDPFARFFEVKVFGKVKSERARRGLGVLCGSLFVLFLIILLLVALIPQLINSVKVLFGNLQGYADAVGRFTDFLGKEREGVDLTWLAQFINSGTEKIRLTLLEHSDKILHGSIRFGQGLFTAGLSIILSFYFLADKHRLQRGVEKFCRGTMSKEHFSFLSDYWKRCNQILVRYILFNLLDGLIVGLTNAVFMSILGMPYVVLISVVVGVANLVPTFGPVVGGAIGAFILVIVNPWHALWFMIFTVALQIVDGYVLKPKLYGNTFGVPSLWVLIMIIVGGRIFGLWGILISIPLAAILSFTFRENIWPWLKKRRKRKDAAIQREEERAEEAEEGKKETGTIEEEQTETEAERQTEKEGKA